MSEDIMPQPSFVLDGASFDTLEGFYHALDEQVLSGEPWGHNLDALDEVLGGGFGPLPKHFTLLWRAAAVSRMRLGYAETVRQLLMRLERCHESNIDSVARSLRAALRREGPTVFDWLVDLIGRHDNIELVFDDASTVPRDV